MEKIRDRWRNTTQAECRIAYIKAANDFLKTIEEIDKATPGSINAGPPAWWREMDASRRLLHDSLAHLDGGSRLASVILNYHSES